MSARLDEVITTALTRVSQEYSQKDVVSPLSVFWFDKTGEWQPVIDRLKKSFLILTFGPYAAASFTGPSIFIRTQVPKAATHTQDRTSPIPIIYLPGYSRDQFKEPSTFPQELKPLAGLYHQSVCWAAKTGKDWTLVTFLQSSELGPGIPIKQDGETKEALRTSIGLLLDEPIDRLAHHAPLSSAYLHQIQLPDPRKQVLTWINDPLETEKQMKESGQWKPFCAISLKEYSINPEKDGALAAAGKLGTQEGKWNEIWDRYTENPNKYSNIPDILSSIKVPSFTPYPESWPQINEKEENDLLGQLATIPSIPLQQAQDLILELEEKHKRRRDWVWARMGKADLSLAIRHLSELVFLTKQIRAGGDLNAQIQRYTNETWKIDDAIISSVASVKSQPHLLLMQTVLPTLYKPWLDTTIEAFQNGWVNSPPEQVKVGLPPEPGMVYLFVDGLRMDIGHRLMSRMATAGYQASLKPRLSIIPSITKTAKPAAMPIAARLFAGEDLTPKTHSGAFARIEALRTLLKDAGYQIIGNDEVGDPTGGGWTECGNIDHEGHDKGLGLAHIIDQELDRIEARIIALIRAGWEKVLIVTDHGWMYLPGGMEKVELPVGKTKEKKGRCALIHPDAPVSFPVLPWFWDRSQLIALAPKSTCFEENKVFDHGGLSPQEMIVPEIVISKGKPSRGAVVITEVKWKGMRCKITVPGGPGYLLDIREQAGDASSSLLKEPISIPIDGALSPAMTDDSYEGKKACIVIIDSVGQIVAQEDTIIGGV